MTRSNFMEEGFTVEETQIFYPGWEDMAAGE